MVVFKFFENQLFNPLFAHLLNADFKKLPVRIKRNPPDDETAMLEDKSKRIKIQQGLGASKDLVLDLPPDVRKKAIEYYDSLKDI